MGILNGKIKPLNGKEHATKEHERRKRDYIRYSQKLVKEAFGENYPVLGVGKPRSGTLMAFFGATMALISILTPRIAIATENAENAQIRCVIGESANQGYDGMLACAEALRNRGTMRGVYGCNAKHIDKQPEYVWDMAKKAWEASKYSNVTKGADHWHNVKREGETYWTKKMIKTTCIKDHCFYK